MYLTSRSRELVVMIKKGEMYPNALNTQAIKMSGPGLHARA